MHLCVASCSSSELRAWTGLSGPQLKMLQLGFLDGTLIPVHDKKRTAKSKNYRRSVNTQVM